MRFLILVAALMAFSGTPLSAQQPELFIGGEQGQAPPKPKPENYLAKCLANPGDKIACYMARTGKTDGGLESAVTSQIDAVSYVACAKTGGVCMEVATIDLDEAVLPSIDITILFDFGKAGIRATERAKLAQLAAALNHPHAAGADFAIIGHTDAKGTDAYNCRLSNARALSVRTQLIALGVASRRLTTIGAGEFVLRNADDGEAPENRRVGFARLGNSIGNGGIVGLLSKLCPF